MPQCILHLHTSKVYKNATELVGSGGKSQQIKQMHSDQRGFLGGECSQVTSRSEGFLGGNAVYAIQLIKQEHLPYNPIYVLLGFWVAVVKQS